MTTKGNTQNSNNTNSNAIRNATSKNTTSNAERNATSKNIASDAERNATSKNTANDSERNTTDDSQNATENVRNYVSGDSARSSSSHRF